MKTAEEILKEKFPSIVDLSNKEGILICEAMEEYVSQSQHLPGKERFKEILKKYFIWNEPSKIDELYAELSAGQSSEKRLNDEPGDDEIKYKQIEDYIIRTWGTDWLKNQWEPGDVIDAIREFHERTNQ